MQKRPKSSRKIFTLGHSTWSLDLFLEILRAYHIQRVVDVRTIPRSRHNPQFNRETLRIFLRNRRINYRNMKMLGGLRRPRPDSLNKGWRNASFRGYADHMQTKEFEEAIQKLSKLASEKPTVILCAEAVPWRCHRSLIGDALLIRHFQVEDIMSQKTSQPHRLTPWAKVRGVKITYPPC